jgi:hypothetical protein
MVKPYEPLRLPTETLVCMHVCMYACMCVEESYGEALRTVTSTHRDSCMYVCMYACMCVEESYGEALRTVTSSHRDSSRRSTASSSKSPTV